MRKIVLKLTVTALLIGVIALLSASNLFTSKSMSNIGNDDATRAFYAPAFLEAEINVNNEVELTWGEPLEWVEIKLSQHDNTPVDGYVEKNFIGYGVLYDLSAYPETTLEKVDFRHSSWDLMGTWSYKIHVVDWNTKTTLKVVGPLNTTGNDKWETGISLSSLAINTNKVAILMQPLGNKADDAYPCIDLDAALNGGSFITLIDDFTQTAAAGGDFLMNLWIMGPPERGEVLAERIEFEKVDSNTDKLSLATRNNGLNTESLDNIAVQTAEVRNTRELSAYALYRFAVEDKQNQELWTSFGKIENLEVLEYTDEGWDELESGFYGYAVKAVYNESDYSAPTFSNILYSGQLTLVTLEITTNTGDSVTGAKVQLNNLSSPEYAYNKVASESGIVVIPDVMPGTYKITVKLDGFDEYVEPSLQINGVVFEHSVELTEMHLPIEKLTYNVFDGNNVELDWLAPGTLKGTPQWLHWDTGANFDAIGTNGPVKFTIATRFTPAQLEEANVIGLNITSVKFFPNHANSTYTVKVWEGGSVNPMNAGTVVASKVASNLTIEDWNTVTLNQPVIIKEGKELWFGVEIDTQGGHPAGTDGGPAKNWFGNLMYWNGSWTTLSTLNGQFDYNWNLQAFADHPERGSIALGEERAVTGYTVKRGATVLAEGIQETSFTDYSVPNGQYIYMVIANYANGVSAPVYTPRITINATGIEAIDMPQATRLNGNYPNPFNPETSISFQLQSDEMVLIEIYNMKGQKIRSLTNERLAAGSHSIDWNGKDDANQEVGSGVYFYKMNAGEYSATKKMILMK